MIQMIEPVLTAAALSGCLWLLRDRARDRSAARMARLDRAGALLAEHAAALERFLDADEPDEDLKRLAMEVSDVAADPARMRQLTERAGARQPTLPSDDPEVRALVAALARLQQVRPDLEEDFGIALDSAVAAARLRWSESVPAAQSLSARMAASPWRRMAIAVIAAHLREPPFGTQPHAGAVA